MTDIMDFAEDHDRVADLEAVARRLSAQLRKEKARTDALVEAVYQAARDAATVAGRAKLTAPKPDRRKKARPEVALVHATDWQVGKNSQTYSTDIAAERMRRLAQKVISIADVQRADHPVRECHLLLGGDMVEGVSIFPGQAFEIDSTLYDQLFAVVGIIEQLVIDLSSSFERVIVTDIHGNHGRLGRRGDTVSTDNTDRMAYRIVRDRLPDVEWNHATDWHQIVNIGNYSALLIHGDQIRSFGGNLPLYGVVRKVMAWKSGVLPPFVDAYVGHFHTHNSVNLAGGGHVFMTGSPESGNEYAREFVAATGTPSQRLHFIDPERGRVTSEYQVHLDD